MFSQVLITLGRSSSVVLYTSNKIRSAVEFQTSTLELRSNGIDELQASVGGGNTNYFMTPATASTTAPAASPIAASAHARAPNPDSVPFPVPVPDPAPAPAPVPTPAPAQLFIIANGFIFISCISCQLLVLGP